jgi:hypothetical protein
MSKDIFFRGFYPAALQMFLEVSIGFAVWCFVWLGPQDLQRCLLTFLIHLYLFSASQHYDRSSSLFLHCDMQQKQVRIHEQKVERIHAD